MKTHSLAPASAKNIILTCCLVLFSAGSLFSATYTWDAEGANELWSTEENWVGDVVPTFAAGDTFDLSTLNITGNSTSTVDSNQTLGIINIGDATVSSHSWLLNSSGGSVITMDNGASSSEITQTSTSFGDTISVPLELKGNLTVSNNSATAARVLTVSGGITSSAASGTQTLSVAGNAAGGMTFSGAIGDGSSGGTMALAVNAPNATVIFSTANTHTGGTTLSAGTVRIATDAFGTNGTVNIDGPITLRGVATDAAALIKGDLNISSDFSYASGAKVYVNSDAISLGNGTRTITMDTGADANLVNTLTFAPPTGGSITIKDGTLKFIGGTGSSATVPTAIEFDLSESLGGAVIFDNANLHIGANATTTFVAAHNVFGTTADLLPNVIVDEDGALNLARRPSGAASSRDLTIASLSGDGKVVNSSNGAGTALLTINGASGTNDAEFSGGIQDGGYNDSTLGLVALTKLGTSTQILSGTNTYTGATTITAGTLLINGSTAAGSAVSVGVGGTLGGTGTIGGATTIDGTLSPGNSPGILTINNDVTIADGGALAIEINGTTVGTNYDRLAITGTSPTFSLTDTNDLVLSLGYTPAVGDLFLIATLTGSNAILGVFEALNGTPTTLTQDSEFSFGGYSWRISYTGDVGSNTFSGAGNDIALQVIPEPSTWALLAIGLGLILLRRRRTARL